MKKHMMTRYSMTTEELLANMEGLAANMESLEYEDIVRLAQQNRQTNELDYRISQIDAIQAELWRRSQVERTGHAKSALSISDEAEKEPGANTNTHLFSDGDR